MRALVQRAVAEADMKLANDAVLVQAVGSNRFTAAKQFTQGRSLGRTHQDVLVLVKGTGSALPAGAVRSRWSSTRQPTRTATTR